MPRRPLIASHRTAVVLGVVLFLGGALFLHDAYEGRGGSTPWWARPFTWW